MDRDEDLIAAIISRGGAFWNLVEQEFSTGGEGADQT
jgi:hypothetical protein